MIKKIVSVLLLIFISFTFQSCLVGRFAWYNFSDITDYKIFPSWALPKSTQPFRFVEAPQKEKVGKARVRVIDSIATANNSVAFLIIRNDSLLLEHYY